MIKIGDNEMRFINTIYRGLFPNALGASTIPERFDLKIDENQPLYTNDYTNVIGSCEEYQNLLDIEINQMREKNEYHCFNRWKHTFKVCS